ncbi:hypothetical protein CRI94_15355 [Longibacter salinarum]|uniref:Roadblock/LAMTOR2 domain-containing protein n=1 Tax=Longibacter salinarum TaxID=1850348 RepID=A0A2A8CU30_9BACT|nr:roadblock/LC7 domain-containing protein [Longibacter salinarum]PEN11412.1 hypothetical protein CRI94_15355 [Longibacter salinarum]
MSTIESINSVLKNLANAIPGQIDGTVIASTDGFVISDTLTGEEAEEVAAMVATTMGVSKRMSLTLTAGDVEETSIKGENRSVFMYRVGGEGVLAVIAAGDANVGMINLRARSAADKIKAYLADPSTASA